MLFHLQVWQTDTCQMCERLYMTKKTPPNLNGVIKSMGWERLSETSVSAPYWSNCWLDVDNKPPWCVRLGYCTTVWSCFEAGDILLQTILLITNRNEGELCMW